MSEYDKFLANLENLKISDINKYKQLTQSELISYIREQQLRLQNNITIPKIIKTLNRSNIDGRRFIYGLLRKYINNISTAMNKYGYIVAEVFTRADINKYISVLQDAGYNVNKIRPKINIAELHKKIYNFQNSMDIKLNNPNLWATSTRVTILETADKPTRQQISSFFKETPTVFYGNKKKMVYPIDMETASLDERGKVLAAQLRKVGFTETLNVSNNPLKPYEVDLENYCRTWASDLQIRASWLTTTHLCEESGIDLVEVLSSPTCCPLCADIDGKIFSLTPNNPDYEYLRIELPVHPNCRHLTVPYTPEFDAFAKEMKEFYGDD